MSSGAADHRKQIHELREHVEVVPENDFLPAQEPVFRDDDVDVQQQQYCNNDELNDAHISVRRSARVSDPKAKLSALNGAVHTDAERARLAIA